MIKIFSVVVLACTFQFAYAQFRDPNLGIIPAPQSVNSTAGQFTFSRDAAIVYGNESDRRIAELFRDFLKDNYFLDIPVARAFVRAPKAIINFSSSTYRGSNPEGYSLSILPDQINISGRDAGLFYGMETLMQLLPLKREAAPKIPCAEISDEPRYKYRGMHLDVGRHMFPVPFIKKYIDLIAQYKLNNFHWHLTEDQGWRIEIRKYPKLTGVGGFRDQTIIGHYHDRIPQYYDGKRYGGYYTQEEVRDVVAYAALRYVNVIPEIEMPGHSLAALAAYPQLGCGDDLSEFKVAERWGVFHDIYCAGKEETFTFLQDVLTEVMALFPGQYIHIGGDEAPKTRWEKCRYCQKRILDNNLKDEHGLQSYFIQRIERFVNSKGRKIIGWDEILEGGLAPNATVMSWRGVNGGIAAAKMQHDAIMTPGSHVYFDHYQGNPVQEPLAIGGFSSLEHVYSYNPTPVNLTPESQKYIIGVQGNVWTEYMKTPVKVEYMVVPRIMALSEIAWTLPEKKNFTEFSELRVPKHLARLDQSETTVYRVPVALGAKDTTVISPRFILDLKPSVEGAKIYYTIDGYTPGETDQLYEGPVQIIIPQDEKRVIKTIVITPSGKKSAVTTTIAGNLSPLPAVNPGARRSGLKYYYIPGEFDLASTLDSARAAERGIVNQINLNQGRNKARSYGMIFDGYINISRPGIYRFSTRSDDGSQLLIDDRVVVDNDGRHTSFELTGAVNLSPGFHKIQVRSFQLGGQSDLKVYMGQAGEPKTEIPEAILFY